MLTYANVLSVALGINPANEAAQSKTKSPGSHMSVALGIKRMALIFQHTILIHELQSCVMDQHAYALNDRD